MHGRPYSKTQAFKYMKIVAMISARLQSTRLENKILLDVAGKPMIRYSALRWPPYDCVV